MAARFTVLAPRLALLVGLWLLAAASFTLAAGGGGSTETTPTTPTATGQNVPATLVVPEVRGQPYVFAKGMLEDAGFAWRVQGSVDGYAANTVVSQNPAPGARIADNGAPTVVLSLSRNSGYKERGLPENSSPYDGTAAVPMSVWRAQHQNETETEPSTAGATTTTTTTEPTTTGTTTDPASPAPTTGKERKPDFVVAGAPPEPADEMPLPQRARLLERRVDAASKSTNALARHWLYQHTWIVTGARFGWADGDKALKTLIRIDSKLERRFGYGARSEKVARAALAYVSSRKS